jgi:Domain of unknown function (DUF4407)
MSQSEDMHGDEYGEASRRSRPTAGTFLILLSGANPEILHRYPSERVKFQSLGWAILITATMATVSMWFALYSAMGINPIGAFPIAIIWGLIIMGIDRWLVVSMPVDGKRKFAVAAPRLLLGLLLGSIISTPIVLRIFESEINTQIAIIKDQNEVNFLNSQQHSSIQGRINTWQTQVSNLQAVITSNGAKPINPDSDPIIQGLNTQLTNERSIAAKDYQAWQCQLYGGCGAPKGSGPLAAASNKRYDNDEAEIATLTAEIQQREQQLQASDVNSQAARLQEAKSTLPNAQAQLRAAQNEEDALLGNFQSTNGATNGLLIRLQALDQLSAGDSTVQMARLVLFLLFLVIELLPVTVKLMQPAGNYERIMRRMSTREMSQAEWDLRGGPGGSGSLYDDDQLHPTAADADFARSRGRSRRRRDPLDAVITGLFEQRTRVESMPGWAGSAQTSDYATPPGDATGPHPFSDRIRGMTDARAQRGPVDRPGGNERRYADYGDDDL